MILAEKTVKNYISNLQAKLGVERRTQAATFAARLDERSAQATRIDGHGDLPGQARPRASSTLYFHRSANPSTAV